MDAEPRRTLPPTTPLSVEDLLARCIAEIEKGATGCHLYTDLAIVTPYRSYAEMAEPETPFPKMLAETLGTERGAQDLLTQFNASFESGAYVIARIRPDLSTQE